MAGHLLFNSGSNESSLAPQFKRKRRGGFLEKYALPPSSESPLKYESASYFSTANYAISLDSCGEYSLRIWIKCFSYIPQFTIINEPI
jgi:hypothetical protein